MLNLKCVQLCLERSVPQKKLAKDLSRKEDTITTFYLFKRDYTTRSDIAEFFKDNAPFLPNEVTLGLNIRLSCLSTHAKLIR